MYNESDIGGFGPVHRPFRSPCSTHCVDVCTRSRLSELHTGERSVVDISLETSSRGLTYRSPASGSRVLLQIVQLYHSESPGLGPTARRRGTSQDFVVVPREIDSNHVTSAPPIRFESSVDGLDL